MRAEWYVYIVSNANRTLYAARKIALIELRNPEWRDLSVWWSDVLRF